MHKYENKKMFCFFILYILGGVSRPEKELKLIHGESCRKEDERAMFMYTFSSPFF